MSYDFWKASIYYCPYSLAENNGAEYVCTLTPRIWWLLGLLCTFCIPPLSPVHFHFSINLRRHTVLLKDPRTALWIVEFCPLAELNNTFFPLHPLISSKNVYLGWQCERPYLHEQTVSLTLQVAVCHVIHILNQSHILLTNAMILFGLANRTPTSWIFKRERSLGKSHGTA